MSTKYYPKSNERLQKKACESYQNVSEEEKTKCAMCFQTKLKPFNRK